MTAKTIKSNLLIFIPLLLVFVTGYYFYNKSPVDVADKKGIAVDGTTLYQAYINDTAVAGTQYGGKVVEISGEIQEVRSVGKGETIILIKSGIDGAFINCSMQDKGGNFPTSGKIVVKGICDGILMDDDLGIPGDVYIKRSVLVN